MAAFGLTGCPPSGVGLLKGDTVRSPASVWRTKNGNLVNSHIGPERLWAARWPRRSSEEREEYFRSRRDKYLVMGMLDGMEGDGTGLVHPRKDIEIWYGGGRIGEGHGGRGLSDEQDPGEKHAPHGVDRNTVSLRRVEQLRSRVR